MGSLMAGWDASVLDPKTARIERNRSLTHEEIKYFKRLRESLQGENRGKDFPSLLKPSNRSEKGEAQAFTGVNSTEEDNNSLADWWTKSDYAFLNEPPLDEAEKSYSYASQFHVAEMATNKH